MAVSWTCLRLFDNIVFVAGVIITVASALLLIGLNQSFPDQVYEKSFLAWVTLFLGILTAIIAVQSCIFGKEGVLGWFVTYGICLLAIGFVIIVFGSFGMVVITQYMLNISNSHMVSFGLPPGVGGSQQGLADTLLGLYNGCCQNSTSINPCPDTITNNGREYCYLDFYFFNRGVEAANSSIDGYCTYEPFVKACEEDNIPAFLRSNYEWFREQVFPYAVLITAIGCVIFLCSVFPFVYSCCLCSRYKNETKVGKREKVINDVETGTAENFTSVATLVESPSEGDSSEESNSKSLQADQLNEANTVLGAESEGGSKQGVDTEDERTETLVEDTKAIMTAKSSESPLEVTDKASGEPSSRVSEKEEKTDAQNESEDETDTEEPAREE